MSSHKLKAKAAFFSFKAFSEWVLNVIIAYSYKSCLYFHTPHLNWPSSNWFHLNWMRKCHFQNSSDNWMVKYKCHSCTLLELFDCFVTNYSSMKVYWGLKSLHLSSRHISECLQLYWRLEHIQHVLQDEKTVKEEILLFNYLNTFLFLPHSFHSLFKIFLGYNGRYPRSWPLYKHAACCNP